MKKLIGKIFILCIVFIAVVCLFGSMYTVAENEYACVVRLSKIVDTIDNAGLHMKLPFIDSIRFFPRDMQLYDINPSEVLTSDKKNMMVDSYVIWEISDPLTFFKSVGTMGEAERRLDAATYTTLKNVMGTLPQAAITNQVDGSERNKIYDTITQSVAEITAQYGINVVDVKIKRLDLPSDNEQAVYSRMISERNQIAEKYKADGEYEASIIINDVDKQVNIIISDAQAAAAKLEAEGEAEYMRMLAEAFNTDDKKSFYQFTLALDALRASLSGNDKTVVLGADAELVKMLIDPQG